MTKFLMLLLTVTAMQAAAEEPSIATLTVADFQEKYESENNDQNREFQQAAQAYLNGYAIGFHDGTMATLISAGIISAGEKPEMDFTDCMPDTRKLFYEMLSVTDERANLTIPTFVMEAVLTRCSSELRELASPSPSR